MSVARQCIKLTRAMQPAESKPRMQCSRHEGDAHVRGSRARDAWCLPCECRNTSVETRACKPLLQGRARAARLAHGEVLGSD